MSQREDWHFIFSWLTTPWRCSCLWGSRVFRQWPLPLAVLNYIEGYTFFPFKISPRATNLEISKGIHSAFCSLDMYQLGWSTHSQPQGLSNFLATALTLMITTWALDLEGSRVHRVHRDRKRGSWQCSLWTYPSRSSSTSCPLSSTLGRVFRSSCFRQTTSHVTGCACSDSHGICHCSAHHEILHQYLTNTSFCWFHFSFSTCSTIKKISWLESTYIMYQYANIWYRGV